MSEESVTHAGSSETGMSDSNAPITIQRIPTRDCSGIIKLGEPLDENNWMAWRVRMKRGLYVSGFEGYAEGTIKRPTNQNDAANWDHNDMFAQFIITNNVSTSEIVHIGQCKTAHAMWLSLEAIHESKDHQTIVAIIRNMLHAAAENNTDISEHLTKLKTYWDRIMTFGDDILLNPDLLFKIVISSSLPNSWDAFTEPYVGGRKGIVETDARKLMSSQEFIGTLKEEYIRRKARADPTESTNLAVAPASQSLANRIGAPTLPNRRMGPPMHCQHCGRRNHNTNDCFYLGAPKCDDCGRFGHIAKNCWDVETLKRKRKEKAKEANNKKAKQEQTLTANEDTQTHASIEEVVDEKEEHLAFQGKGETMKFDVPDEEEYVGLDEYDPAGIIEDQVLYYDWLADSATTSHITNQREALTNYKPAHGITVAGVGNAKTTVQGRGTVELESKCEGRKFVLQLDNVLYIPTNRNNLLSLGRWEASGRKYIGEGGKITMINERGVPVATGNRIKNHLCKMDVKLC
jgi:hypothetical protein